MTEQKNNKISIYLHIPFCKSKCGYCSFASGIYPESVIKRYFELLPKEFDLFFNDFSESLEVPTLYIGGGTPSAVPPYILSDIIAKLLSMIHNKPSEITIEANPGDIDHSFIKTCEEIGVTRISLGVQSFKDNVLAFLGRRHSASQAVDAFNLLRESGFSNISIDLIHGVPTFGPDRWLIDLKSILDLSPEHISLYALSIEEGTPFHENKIYEKIDNDHVATEYHLAVKMLRDAGYNRYEISNFSKPGYECTHNLNYWHMGNYIGFGVSAASFIDGIYFQRFQDVSKYIECLEKGISTIESLEEFHGRDRWVNAMIMGMRLEDGIHIHEFNRRFGIDISKVVKDKWRNYIDDSHVIMDDERIRFGDKGFYVSNSFLSMLI